MEIIGMQLKSLHIPEQNLNIKWTIHHKQNNSRKTHPPPQKTNNNKVTTPLCFLSIAP